MWLFRFVLRLLHDFSPVTPRGQSAWIVAAAFLCFLGVFFASY